jgi:predicted small metal-binding protein
MKKMTCTQMGGSCDFEMSAETTDEMIAEGTKHVQEAHPDMVEAMSKMSQEENDKWKTDFMTKWEATPEAV